MTEDERNMDLTIADLEQENRLLRARNERLEKELALEKMANNAIELGLDYIDPIADFKHRLAKSIEAMPFGDTAASFAVYVREFE